MSIQDTFEFDNTGQVVKFPLFKRVFLGLTIVLVALLAFGIGRLSGQGREGGVKIEYDPSLIDGTSTPTKVSQGDATVAVKQTASVISGTSQIFASSQGKRYYYPGCKSTVSEKNKVFFADAKTAEAAGYTLATTCKPR